MIFHVRNYQPEDLSNVLSSFETASYIAHPFLSKEFIKQELDNIANLYLPNTDTWVIEKEKNVIGFLSLMGNEIGGLFVKPEFHGIGAGKSLMGKAKELHGDLEVEVFKANHIGRNFYEKCNFALMLEKTHEQTGNELLRLKFTA
jgi:putative acetyltransferase